MVTYTTRLIFKRKSDHANVIKMLKASRLAWNECSKIKFKQVPKNSIVDLHAAFYRNFRNAHPTIPSTLVIAAEQSVLASYRSEKSCTKLSKIPHVKTKLSLRLTKNSFKNKNGVFSIIAMGPRIKCTPHLYPKLQDYLEQYTFCDPELFVRDSRVWISLTFKIPEKLPKQTLALGIDLGCRVNAATSEGNIYIDKKFNKEKRALRYLKRKLRSVADRGSKSAKKHLKKLWRKERNKNKNFTHHLCNKLIKDTIADVLVIENLKSIKVKKNYVNKNRISQVPFYQLKEFLTYKAPLKGKTVIEVCPSYTSQIDHQTEKKDGERKGRRYYSKSGKVYDSDINGAVNIGLRSKLPVSLYPKGYETYGQAKVRTPIVG